MRTSLASSTIGLLLLGLVGCGDERPPADAGSRSSGKQSLGEESVEPPLPDGWRWEGFHGVLVGVPGDWAWGTGNQRVDQWCVGEDPKPPIVGRPAGQTAVGCPELEDGVDPSSLMKNTGMVVELTTDLPDEPERRRDEGDRAVLRFGDVLVRVTAPAELREAILASAHEADTDANGCPMRLPTEFDPGDPPSQIRDVSTLSGVTALAVCKYTIPWSDESSDQELPLYSSLLLEGSSAQDVVTAFAAAPPGGGPDNPQDCMPEYGYGDDMIVVFIDSDQGRSAVNVYYSGCDHNGIDDGVTLRALTRDAVQPLIQNANVLTGYSANEAKHEILRAD